MGFKTRRTTNTICLYVPLSSLCFISLHDSSFVYLSVTVDSSMRIHFPASIRNSTYISACVFIFYELMNLSIVHPFVRHLFVYLAVCKHVCTSLPFQFPPFMYKTKLSFCRYINVMLQRSLFCGGSHLICLFVAISLHFARQI